MLPSRRRRPEETIVSRHAGKRAAREGETHAAPKTTGTYLAGIGTSGALVAGAAIVFVISVGAASFDVWPGGGDNGSPSGGVVELGPAGPGLGPDIAQVVPTPVAPSGAAVTPAAGAGGGAGGGGGAGNGDGAGGGGNQGTGGKAPGGNGSPPPPTGDDGGDTGDDDTETPGRGGGSGKDAPLPGDDDDDDKAGRQLDDDRAARRQAREDQNEASRKREAVEIVGKAKDILGLDDDDDSQPPQDTGTGGRRGSRDEGSGHCRNRGSRSSSQGYRGGSSSQGYRGSGSRSRGGSRGYGRSSDDDD
jgi:hypothetical protein